MKKRILAALTALAAAASLTGCAESGSTNGIAQYIEDIYAGAGGNAESSEVIMIGDEGTSQAPVTPVGGSAEFEAPEEREPVESAESSAPVESAPVSSSSNPVASTPSNTTVTAPQSSSSVTSSVKPATTPTAATPSVSSSSTPSSTTSKPAASTSTPAASSSSTTSAKPKPSPSVPGQELCDEIGHDWVHTNTKETKRLSDGKISVVETYKCNRCGLNKQDEYVREDTTPAAQNNTTPSTTTPSSNTNNSSNKNPTTPSSSSSSSSTTKPTETKPTTPSTPATTPSSSSSSSSSTATPVEQPKPAHTHSYTSKVTANATCGKAGTRTYTCSCGDSYTETIAALSHNYNNGVVTTEATCCDNGVKTYTCANCNNKKTESIPALGHSWKTKTVYGSKQVPKTETWYRIAQYDAYNTSVDALRNYNTINFISEGRIDSIKDRLFVQTAEWWTNGSEINYIWKVGDTGMDPTVDAMNRMWDKVREILGQPELNAYDIAGMTGNWTEKQFTIETEERTSTTEFMTVPDDKIVKTCTRCGATEES